MLWPIPRLHHRFYLQNEYQNSVVPRLESNIVVVEAGTSQGWDVISDTPVLKICMLQFGESAPYQILAEKFGFSGKQVADKVRSWIDRV